MSEELLLLHGAPTLAGIKTGNLFTCAYTDKKSLFEELRRINRKLVPKGLRLLPLKMKNGKALLYLYRPAHLKRDLAREEALSILTEAGYVAASEQEIFRTLTKRLNGDDEFPHEIGLFLGYPPEDVRGFIENRAENYKDVGLWKVYGDKETAQKMFERCNKCTQMYCKLYRDGKSLSDLTVASA